MNENVNPSLLYQQALAAYNANQPDEAHALLIRLLRASPHHEQAWLLLSAVVPDLEQTIECLHRVLALNPENAQARQWLTFALDGAEENAASSGADKAKKPALGGRAVPFLGKYMLDNRFITEAQLAAALRVQDAEARTGKPRRIGEILVEQGAISEQRLKFVVRQQEIEFFSLMQG